MRNRWQFGDAASVVSAESGAPDGRAKVLRPARSNRHSRALLVFANSPAFDCHKRRWPSSFRNLFLTARLDEFCVPGTDVHLFTPERLSSEQGGQCTVHLQKGTVGTFGIRLESAVEHLAVAGYDEIVIVGSDCPSLTQDDVRNAFDLLRHKRLVLGPDHRGGCYLIGIRASDRPEFTRICWHMNTDFQQLLDLFGEAATGLLKRKIDLDTLADLRLLASSAEVGGALAAALVTNLTVCHFETARLILTRCDRHTVLSWQLPPPLPVSA
jgi:hypothetical protein